MTKTLTKTEVAGRLHDMARELVGVPEFSGFVDDLAAAALWLKSEECSRQPETADDPQNTADQGEGIDRPGPVKSSGVSNARDYDTPKKLRTQSPMPDAPISDTPNDTAKTSMSEPVSVSTPGDENGHANSGTQKTDVTAVAVQIAKVIAYARLKNAYGTVQDKDLDDMWGQMLVEAKAVEGFLRCVDLKERVGNTPAWGAAVGVWAEEHDAIAKQIGLPLLRRVDGIPCAD